MTNDARYLRDAPLERVTAAADAAVTAEHELRRQVRAAVACGIPQTKVAAAAGVDRNTIARWVREDN